MTRVQELGLSVPEDISVAGYDGIELGGYLRPTLTTVKTAPAEIGAEAARLLLDVIDGLDVSDVDVAAAALLLRESTGPVPEAAGRKAERRRRRLPAP
jgi:DNA-binding LacI/PurR family transcriptional regulator